MIVTLEQIQFRAETLRRYPPHYGVYLIDGQWAPAAIVSPNSPWFIDTVGALLERLVLAEV